MSAHFTLLGIGAAAPNRFVAKPPRLRHPARLRLGPVDGIVYTTFDRTVGQNSPAVSATVLDTGFLNVRAPLFACIDAIITINAGTPVRTTCAVKTASVTRLAALTTVFSVVGKIFTHAIACSASHAVKADRNNFGHFVTRLIKKPRSEDSGHLSVRKVDLIGLVNLVPRQHDRVGAGLPRRDERPEVDRFIFAEQAASDDVLHPVRIGQDRRERDGLSIGQLLDVRAEAEEHGRSRVLASRGRLRRVYRGLHAGHRGLRAPHRAIRRSRRGYIRGPGHFVAGLVRRTRGQRLQCRWRSRRRRTAISARGQPEKNGDFAPVLHGSDAATHSPTPQSSR